MLNVIMTIWALERATCYNLFCAEKAQKRIFTPIPSAKKIIKTNLLGLSQSGSTIY
jgi:hypothetical protein